ncbi:MAG: dTDP-4-dehydrorhamnose reductase [Rickettsia endosymbiont of Ixodes persulcatus]|nr:dTDP-4-dehydrorhamnose reductase [Rickettsia endosymbiont of Ixodes persulcatus]
MKLLLTGANGQIGHEIKALAKKTGFEVYAFSKAELNITQSMQVKRIFSEVNPHYIINAAAYTVVDRAETESEAAFSVNGSGVKYLAEAARQAGIPLLHISTDYVFDGEKKTAYLEEDATNPLSIYGKSKLAGEDFIRQIWYKHIILRVSWVFGYYGSNFVKTIVQIAKQKYELRIVCDQYGGPTYAIDIAETLLKIVNALQNGCNSWGTYHYSGLPMTNWHQFASCIIETSSCIHSLATKLILPIPASAYPTLAYRPYNSQLLSNKIERVFNIVPKKWQDGLIEVIERLA